MKKYSLAERYGMVRSRLSIIMEDVRTTTNIPIGERLSLLRRGFCSRDYALMDDYLSEYERRKTRFINGQASYMLSNKLICDQILEQYVKTARIYGLVQKGHIYPVDSTGNITDYDSLVNYLDESQPLILKPNSGTDGGRGVMLISIENGKVCCNKNEVDLNVFKSLVDSLDGYLVCEFIRQGNYGNYLFAESVNTIRILTMMCPQEHKPFIPISIQRIGTHASKPVDNWSAGGLSAHIDADTGLLSEAVSFRDGIVEWHKTHPDTGIPIEGIQVPNWHRIKEDILTLAAKLPYLSYIAWGVVPMDKKLLVIEANNCPGVDLLQAHKPLLKNEKARAFHKYYGIIK